MTKTAFLGPPGTGKTYTLMRLVEDYIRNHNTDPQNIGFVSFSKKATEEARNRAAAELSLDYKNMPHFRTLHSMAFRQLGLRIEDVMRGADYRKLEEMLGLEFHANSSISMNDAEFFRIGGKGDMYLSIYNMARVRGVEPEHQFHRQANWSLHIGEFEQVYTAYEEYKRELKKMDFTDMIQRFVSEGEAPFLDVLIVDEAQDLVPLQWDMIDRMEERATDVFYAGDDDQAIYEWMGVEPYDFIERVHDADKRVLLDQSYRVPQRVHQYATQITDRMFTRIAKKYEPRESAGDVSYHFSLDELDLEEGQWMVLCRTNYIANKIGGQLKGRGLLYWRAGNGWSVSNKTLEAVRNFTRLVKGQSLGRTEFQEVWTMIKVDRATRRQGNKLIKERVQIGFDFEEQPEKFDLELLSEMVKRDLTDKPWYEVLDVQAKERVYITSVLNSGDKFDEENPRIVLSTIHKAKGGEAENVALFLESTKACCTMGDPDGERRVFYVGATRAKENLHVIDNHEAKWKFEG